MLTAPRAGGDDGRPLSCVRRGRPGRTTCRPPRAGQGVRRPTGPQEGACRIAERYISVVASGNGSFGIVIGGDSASVKSVTASGNGDDGIHIIGDAPVVSGNTTHANGFPGGSSDNVGLGVNVTGFTTVPTGSNDALANDNPAECDPANLC